MRWLVSSSPHNPEKISRTGSCDPEIHEVEGLLSVHYRFSARRTRRDSVSVVSSAGQILFRLRILLYYKYTKLFPKRGYQPNVFQSRLELPLIELPPPRVVGIPGLESEDSPDLGFLPMSVVSPYPKGTTIFTSKTLLTLWRFLFTDVLSYHRPLSDWMFTHRASTSTSVNFSISLHCRRRLLRRDACRSRYLVLRQRQIAGSFSVLINERQ